MKNEEKNWVRNRIIMGSKVPFQYSCPSMTLLLLYIFMTRFKQIKHVELVEQNIKIFVYSTNSVDTFITHGCFSYNNDCLLGNWQKNRERWQRYCKKQQCNIIANVSILLLLDVNTENKPEPCQMNELLSKMK